MTDILMGLIRVLQFEIERPKVFGAFHVSCLAISLAAVVLLLRCDRQDHEKTLRTALGCYGFIALLLETAKQIIWSYDGVWSYQWYAAPFQLCTTPIFASIAACFMPKCRLRDRLLSYMAFVTILGSIATAVYPESCFVKTLLVDIHTMFLHLGSLALSVYLLATEVGTTERSFWDGYAVFLLFAAFAEFLNIAVYKSGILGGQTFNMFYISPYFVSSLPVFNIIQQNVPFPVFLLTYLLAILAGARIVFAISSKIAKGGSRQST